MAAPNRMNFPKGGRGVIFNPKTYVADFGLFEHEIDTKE